MDDSQQSEQAQKHTVKYFVIIQIQKCVGFLPHNRYQMKKVIHCQ